MAILTKPTVNKNQAASFTLDKDELALVASVVGNAYFADPANWKTIRLRYESSVGGQREIVVFDATGVGSTTTGEFLVSERARDEFLVRKITIEDFDNGYHDIMRTELNEEEFDIFFNLITGYSLYLSGTMSSFSVGLPLSITAVSMQRVAGMDSNDIVSVALLNDRDMLIIKSDGTLWGIGYNNRGELGLGHRNVVTSFTQVGTATDWKSVFPSPDDSFFAIKTDNTMWGAGIFWYGVSGNGSNTLSSYDTNNIFVQLNPSTDWKTMGTNFSSAYSGDETMFAIKTDGTLWITGRRSYEHGLGGAYPGTGTWTKIGSDTDWKSVCTYGDATFAIKENGKMYVAGKTTSGMFNIQYGKFVNNIRPAGYDYQVFTELSSSVMDDVKHISANGFNLMVVKNNGTLWAIGDNGVYTQLGLGDANPRDNFFVQVGSDTDWESVHMTSYTSVAKKTNGRVYSAGNQYGVSGLVSSNSTFVSDPSMPTADKIFASRERIAYLRFRPAQALKNVFSAYNPNFKVGLASLGNAFLSYNASYMSPISNNRVESFYGFNDRDSIVNDNRIGQFALSFSQKGTSAAPNYLVIDLGQEYTFNSLYTFASPDQNSAYPSVTRIAIDISANGQLNTISSPDWTAVNYTNPVNELDTGYLIIPDVPMSGGASATIGTFAPVTARYIRIKCYYNGALNYISQPYFYNMKLFNVA